MRASRVRKRLLQGPLEVWTGLLEEQPAVQAWRALGAGPCPSRLELLKEHGKSVVYRLPGVAGDGSDVIAKRGLWQDAVVERATYELLRELPLACLAYYGFVPEPERGHGWLFLEDAGSEPWDPEVPAHRQAATRWFAGLHTASSRTSRAGCLPDRGLLWVRENLDGALTRIRAGFANAALAREARPVLDGMLRTLDRAQACWDEIEEACAPMPHALVHCDLQERNVRIRDAGSGPRVLVFDWEFAGWGLPAVDLVDMDPATYADAVGADWPGLDLPAFERFVQLGELLRGVTAANWAAMSLASHWPAHAVSELAIYRGKVARALAALGLSAEAAP